MGLSVGLRGIGPTVALSVGATSTTAVSIVGTSNEALTFARMLNTGPNPVFLTLSTTTAAASVIPVPGAPQVGIMLPANMLMAVTYAVPSATPGTSFSVTGIGTAAGPALVYITPVAAQS